jgi:hypothetical protein
MQETGIVEKHPLRRARESGATPAELAALLAPDVVFHSPILAKPVIGRELVSQVMATAAAIRNGEYTEELRQDRRCFLMWKGTIEGEPIECFELLLDNEAGLVVRRSIAMRPLSAALHFRQVFIERMKGTLPPEYFELPPGSIGVAASAKE